MSEESERDDPVLVRPYITTQPGGVTAGHDDRATQTWPATADLPEDGTGELAAVDPPAAVPDPATKSTALRRQRLMVLAGIVALALLGGAGLLLLLPSDDDNAPAAVLPVPAPSMTGSVGAAPVASGATLNAPPTNAGVSRSAAASRTVTSPAPGVPGQQATTAPPTGAPSATLVPPPDPARTGPITAAGGRCLTLGGLLGIGGPVQTARCSDVSYQRWTMASDGTLRVVDRCARVDDDAAVRLDDCDDQPAAQWRAGPNGSLVNPETGRCLTDPGTAMTTVSVTDCTGAADQRWTLP